MNPDRLKELIAAYGADHRRWPAAERGAARALLQRLPELGVEIDRMAALDAALDRWAGPAPPVDAAALAARVSAMPQRRAVPARAWRLRWPDFAWPNAAGLAAVAVAGFLVGWSHLDSDLLNGNQTDSIDGQIVASVIEDATW